MVSELNKRKTLVDIDLPTWARVKHLATIREISVNDAVQILLRLGLGNFGYNVKGRKMVPSVKNLTASRQKAPSLEIQR
jgi:hypothetical protein